MRVVTATLGIQRRVENDPDRYGNPAVSFAPSEPWPVYGVAPRGQGGLSEPAEANRDLVVRGLTVFAPADGPRPGALDRVEYRGEVWQVAGDVAEWDRNPHVPHTTQRGVVVNLDRVEG